MLLLYPYMKEIRQMHTFTAEVLEANEEVKSKDLTKALEVIDLWQKSTMEMAYILGERTDLTCDELKHVLEQLLFKYEYHLERNIKVAIGQSLEIKDYVEY